MNRSVRAVLPALLALFPFLAGCAVRSISNTARPWGNENTTYAGELTDFDVVGTAAREPGAAPGEVRLRRGQRVLVVQSGAGFPDEPMLTGLGEHFQVGAASGAPSRMAGGEQGMLAAAARGGFDAVIAYWGILESRSRATEGKLALWIPVVGAFVPDEEQQMRIRLRIVVADTRSGRWHCLLPTPIDDARASSMVTRTSKDQEQVEVLKQAAYQAAVAEIVALAEG